MSLPRADWKAASPLLVASSMRPIVVFTGLASALALVVERVVGGCATREARARVQPGTDARLVLYAARFLADGSPLADEHIMVTALLDGRVAAALTAGGASLAALRAELLGVAPRAAGETLSRAQKIARRRGAGEISLGDLLRALRERGARFSERLPAELAPFDAERAVEVSGRAPLTDNSDGEIDVFAVNDAETTMAAVMEVLRGAFGLAPERAAFAMLEAHEKGHGFVGRFPAAEARARMAQAADQALALGVPLRFAAFFAA